VSAESRPVAETDGLREQLASLHHISVEIAALRDLQDLYDRTLAYCLQLTDSEMGAIDLLTEDGKGLKIVAVTGFEPADQAFFERYQTTPVRPSLFGLVIIEGRSRISNDVPNDPARAGMPDGHPALTTFLGVPLRVGGAVIGMIAVANRPVGYTDEDERLLATFANQVAVAIDNARLYERQREMIAALETFHRRLDETEREHLLTRERLRIASGLHADIQQGLFTIGLRLSTLLDQAPDPLVAEELRLLQALAAETVQQLRSLVFAMAEGEEAPTDLIGAARTLLHILVEGSGIEADLVITGTPRPCAEDVRRVLYSVIKEALTNVVKHAKASVVLVSVRFEPTTVSVVVQDDGVGIDAGGLRNDAGTSEHFGLRHMHRQLLEVGGSLTLVNGDESGLTLTVTAPLSP
jgi:signal transduction histidine kinase